MVAVVGDVRARTSILRSPRAFVDHDDADRAVGGAGRERLDVAVRAGFARRDRERPRPGGCGLSEQVEAVVLGEDRAVPLPVCVAQPEQLVRRSRERVDVDAVDPEVGQVEQRLQRPQGGGERPAGRRIPAARDRVDLVDPYRDVVGVGLADRAADARRELLRGSFGEQMRDCRVCRVVALDVTALEGVAVDGGHGDVAVVFEEPPDVGEPSGPAGRRSGERDVSERPGDPCVVTAERGEVIVARASRLARVPPRERPVQLRFVAELERLYVVGSEAGGELVGLGRRDGGAVGLEVDPEREPRPGRGGERSCDRDPVRGQRLVDAGRGSHPGDRPPCEVGGVAADPELRRGVAGEVPDQLDEHRIDVLGVGSGECGDREVFEREAEEAGRDRACGGRSADRDTGCSAGAGPACATCATRSRRGRGRGRGRGPGRSSPEASVDVSRRRHHLYKKSTGLTLTVDGSATLANS